jgi:putative DNA methylase
VRYYGQWVRDEAEKRIGHLYPKAKLLDGSEARVIAWLWARTVRSPDPAAKGAMVSLVSSFMLSTTEGKKACVKVAFDPAAPDGWRFEVKTGPLSTGEEEKLAEGTKAAKAAFRCVLTGANIGGAYIDSEAQAGRMGARLMAIVAEAARARTYLSPIFAHEQAADAAARHVAENSDAMHIPLQECRGTFASNAQGRRYFFKTFSDYFIPRQLIALTTFSDLVSEAHARVLADARAAGPADDDAPLYLGGTGATAYADTVATYLAFAIDRAANYGSTLSTWLTDGNAIRGTFGRQALQMAWDFCEGSYFGNSSAAFTTILKTVSNVIGYQAAFWVGLIAQIDAARNDYPVQPCIINTDPPYYDNISYAELSDFFYVWLRRSLISIWPHLFSRLTTPKEEELMPRGTVMVVKKKLRSFLCEAWVML